MSKDKNRGRKVRINLLLEYLKLLVRLAEADPEKGHYRNRTDKILGRIETEMGLVNERKVSDKKDV